MRSARLLKILVLMIFLSIIGLFFYFDSNFVEEKRLKKIIENDFDVNLISPISLIEKQYYGGLEEGGNKSLIELDVKDCFAISEKMINYQGVHKLSEYYDFFEKHNIEISEIKTMERELKNKDYLQYVLEMNKCILFRLYHAE